MQARGYDVATLKTRIDELITKTLICAQPELWKIYRAAQPEDHENQLCFQILGFDVLIDRYMKPWLLEVNHAPSLSTDSQFDLTVKRRVVEDTMRLLNLSLKRKMTYMSQLRKNF